MKSKSEIKNQIIYSYISEALGEIKFNEIIKDYLESLKNQLKNDEMILDDWEADQLFDIINDQSADFDELESLIRKSFFNYLSENCI